MINESTFLLFKKLGFYEFIVGYLEGWRNPLFEFVNFIGTSVLIFFFNPGIYCFLFQSNKNSRENSQHSVSEFSVRCRRAFLLSFSSV